MFELPLLRYPVNGLEPVLSRDTVWRHYHVLHAGYLRKVNERLNLRPIDKGSLTLWDLANGHKRTRFPAAQAWMHTWYWASMSPPGEPLGVRIDYDKFGRAANANMGMVREAMVQAAEQLETGSGWVWLCRDVHGRLQVMASRDGEIPARVRLMGAHSGLDPVLLCDVWEHAYICDIDSRREYVERWFEELADWRAAYRRYRDPRPTADAMKST